MRKKITIYDLIKEFREGVKVFSEFEKWKFIAAIIIWAAMVYNLRYLLIKNNSWIEWITLSGLWYTSFIFFLFLLDITGINKYLIKYKKQ